VKLSTKRRVIFAIIVAFGVSACQTTGNKQTAGFALGAAAGAAAGSQVGSGTGRLAAILIGALIGAAAGSAIGAELDEADRLKADKAAAEAANAQAGGVVSWSSESNDGVYGYAQPVSPAVVDDDDLCKTVKSVYYLEGEETTEIKKFCMRSGRWVEA